MSWLGRGRGPGLLGGLLLRSLLLAVGGGLLGRRCLPARGGRDRAGRTHPALRA